MKKKFGVFTFLMILGIVISFGALFNICPKCEKTAANALAPENSAAKITVVGKGEIMAVPDEATVNFSIETNALEVSSAQKENITKFDNIKAIFDTYNIDDKDIKTVGYNIYKEYDYSKSDRKFSGFVVKNNVNIKIKELDILGKFIAELGDNGVNNISNISFNCSNCDELYNQALSKAIEDATSKAQLLAGDKTLNVTDICEESYHFGQAIMFKSVDMMSAANEGVPIYNGETKITANVKVTFSF